MPSFSIIVPVLGDAIDFENTLASVLRNLPADSEVIVVHDGTYEDIHEIGLEVEFVQTDQRAQLIRMFNAGIRRSDAEFVLLVRPGMELPFHWEAGVIEAFDDPQVGSVSPAIVATSQKSQLVTAGVEHKLGLRRSLVGHGTRMAPRKLRKLNPVGPTSWAACYRRSALDQFGTPDETLDPVYLDMDLALGLRTLGLKSVFISDCVFSISRPTLIMKEAEQPHGLSAQRAAKRHVRHQSGSTAMITVCELARSVTRPTMFQHVMQRWGAGKFSDVDELFARRLKEKKMLAQVEREDHALERSYQRAA